MRLLTTDTTCPDRCRRGKDQTAAYSKHPQKGERGMTRHTTIRSLEQRSKNKRGALLVALALGVAMITPVGLAASIRHADAASSEKIVFASNRAAGKGVDNNTGDREIFRMNPNGTSPKQLTSNTQHDVEPALSPDGTKIAYQSRGDQTSNPEGDWEIYVMNAEGSGNKNLTDNGASVNDLVPEFSPDGTRIGYQSVGVQNSNGEGDSEVYAMNAGDGTDKKNLSNTYLGIDDYDAAFSPNGNRVTGNYVGTDKSGISPLGNSDGVFIEEAPNNTVGGTTAGTRNVISGNDSEGV